MTDETETEDVKGKEDAPKKPGVIAKIVEHLQDGGGTAEEIADKLAEDFPDRDRKGMLSTVRIQVNRLTKPPKNLVITKEKVDGRGVVYSIA